MNDTAPNWKSLYELLSECEVRIPIIQRDYAQGRKSEHANEVRKRLIDDMIDCLETGKRLDFNFIYGNIANSESSKKIFYPVDGQQRLTSLYLLHWYIACRAKELHSFNEVCKFSYMTRNSASEFFALLKKPELELEKLIHNEKDFTKKIMNYPWFRAEWGNDPTVISVLNFLSDLSAKELNGREKEYYAKLIAPDSAIYFTVLIEDSKNAEISAAQKYIRMNARGKVLTTFENVKAMLDGIDARLTTKTDIIKDYDISFIDIFYDRSNHNFDIDEKTKQIDDMTICFFRHIYNVVAVVHGEEPYNSELEYANKMYSFSQGDFNKDFIRFYFNMLEAVLRAMKWDGIKSFIDIVFSNRFDFNDEKSKYEIACFLYIYYLYI